MRSPEYFDRHYRSELDYGEILLALFVNNVYDSYTFTTESDGRDIQLTFGDGVLKHGGNYGATYEFQIDHDKAPPTGLHLRFKPYFSAFELPTEWLHRFFKDRLKAVPYEWELPPRKQ